jgi:hypothetical protein
MIEPELFAMAKKIDSKELPLDPNAYALAVYDGYEKLWKRQATEAERARIIALLEGDIAICKEFGHQDNDADCDAGCDAVRHCIALIKGEIE